MSLKDWMNKIEKQQLDEVAPPSGAVAIPSVQGQGNIQASFVAPAKQGDKTTTDILNTLAKNKSIVTVGAQPVPGQPQQTTSTQQPAQAQQKPGMTVPGQTTVQEEEVAEVAPPGMEDVVMALKKKFPGQPEKAFAIAWHNYNQRHGKTEESVSESGPHDHDFVEKSARHERLRDLAKRMGDQKQYDFHDAEIKKLYSKDKQDTKESMMSESKQINESTLDEILGNHPHEHKMAQEGWGLDESLFHALSEHYFKEGRIPRAIWHGPVEDLRAHVEECYAQDTMPLEEGRNTDDPFDDMVEDYLDWLESRDMLYKSRAVEKAEIIDGLKSGVIHPSEIEYAMQDDLEEGFMDTVKKVGGKVLDTLGHGSDEELLDKIRPPKEEAPTDAFADELEEETELERMLKEPSTSMKHKEITPRETESSMFEGKDKWIKGAIKDKGAFSKKAAAHGETPAEFQKDVLSHKDKFPAKTEKQAQLRKTLVGLDEATKETKTGRVHTADAGGYGRKDDEDDEGKKVADTVKRGRGRPKKGGDETGEVKKYDWSAFGATGKDVKLPKWDKKKTTTHKIATKADREDLEEGETIEKKGGRIHKGSYGTSHEAGDEGVAKEPTTRGRGRPKKGADNSGEVKKYDWSAFGATGKDVKLPKWDKKKTTTHKIATKADREEVDEALKGKQRKLDVDHDGKIEKSDLALLRGKKKDAQMESWDRQLKGLLTEGLTVSTSVGNQGGQDSVSITANDEDAHKLLALLQNAGIGSGVPGHAVQAGTAPAAVQDTEGATKGGWFSQASDEEAPDAPEEIDTAEQGEIIDALGGEQASAEDDGSEALAALKKLMGRHGTEEVSQEVEEEKGEKKPDEDGDGVPDWADKKPGKDDNAEDGEKEEVDEGEWDGTGATDAASADREAAEDTAQAETEEETSLSEDEKCGHCGEHLEEGHECDQLNEWSNSPQGQSEDEQFDADIEFMMKGITAGLNGQKSTGQATTPVLASQTNRQVSENVDIAAQMRKLAGIR